MNKCEFEAYTLPDIEMYGGDNASWEVVLTRPDGQPWTAQSANGYTCVLSFLPFTVTTGLSNRAVSTQPVLKKNGNVTIEVGDKVVAGFVFDEADTKSLRGKYTYQVEVRRNINNTMDVRVCQGNLYIKSNINR